MDALDCSCAFAPGLNLRVIDKDGQPWFVAKDVCVALGLKDPTMAVARIDPQDKAQFSLGLRGCPPNMVNESGLYSLILRSDKPEAQRFRKWVTSEVLPAIRKTGSYTVPQKAAVFDRPAPHQVVTALAGLWQTSTALGREVRPAEPLGPAQPECLAPGSRCQR